MSGKKVGPAAGATQHYEGREVSNSYRKMYISLGPILCINVFYVSIQKTLSLRIKIDFEEKKRIHIKYMKFLIMNSVNLKWALH